VPVAPLNRPSPTHLARYHDALSVPAGRLSSKDAARKKGKDAAQRKGSSRQTRQQRSTAGRATGKREEDDEEGEQHPEDLPLHVGPANPAPLVQVPARRIAASAGRRRSAASADPTVRKSTADCWRRQEQDGLPIISRAARAPVRAVKTGWTAGSSPAAR
jgi:hypothetical protein